MRLRSLSAKILLRFILLAFLASCNAVKRIPDGALLLDENNIKVDGKLSRNADLNSLPYQKPNTDIFGFPFRLHVYNLAKPIDTTSAKWKRQQKRIDRKIERKTARGKEVDTLRLNRGGLNGWLIRNGEAPVIISERTAEQSALRMEAFQKNRGWFDARVNYEIDTLSKTKKRGAVNYQIENGKPFVIDTFNYQIESQVIDSLYQKAKPGSLIKTKKQFATIDFENERARLTTFLRNSGVFHFQQSLIKYELDTLSQIPDSLQKKVQVSMVIPNRIVREGDTRRSEPFKIFTISKVNIFTDYAVDGSQQDFKAVRRIGDFTIFGKDEIKYRTSAMLNPIFFEPGKVYRDIDRSLTLKHINELKTFRYPNIEFEEDPSDSIQNSLIANIFLSPLNKYSLGFNTDITHSNIQDFGIEFSTTLSVRNVFRGTETLEIGLRGSLGSSKDLADSNNNFFNVTEFGADIRLNFPRILFFTDTQSFIPKTASPLTQISIGGSLQQNIGLDRQTLTGNFGYRWNPRQGVNHVLDLLNIQYVKNLNTGNYFNVYRTSFRDLNDIALQFNQNPNNLDTNGNLSIPDGANNFINEVLNQQTAIQPGTDAFDDVRNIEDRRIRLTDDNLIFSGSFTKTITNRSGFSDNNFYRFRGRLEAAGNLVSSLSSVMGLKENDKGNFEIFNVAFSQYIKTELDFIKYWDMNQSKVLAFRTFVGLAVPYGNSQNIPFTKSFFGGGSNDNRAWAPYSLGPGESDNNNEFNEANMKIALSTEYRFPILGGFKGALFADAGNIWNVFDDNEVEAANFDGLSSLEDIALGTGVGIRYDFSFFVLRFDAGFKTYDPSEPDGSRWFRKYNFGNAVWNIGINYPF
ncbi:MAG: outer membrane protein assembly factor [Bacteroidetes bacterium]|nr:outer membrane protein assembly factor [Bacteroidota bacterium]